MHIDDLKEQVKAYVILHTTKHGPNAIRMLYGLQDLKKYVVWADYELITNEGEFVIFARSKLSDDIGEVQPNLKEELDQEISEAKAFLRGMSMALQGE